MIETRPIDMLTRCPLSRGSTPAAPAPWRTLAVTCVLTAVLTLAQPAAAIPHRLLQAVPADATAAVLYEPVDDATAGAGAVLSLATLLLERGREMGFAAKFGEALGRTLDIVGSLPVVAQHPLAIILLDVSSVPRPAGGAQLETLSIGLVIDTDAKNNALAQRVRYLLDIYTNNAHGRIDQIEVEGETSYRLTDSRLPEWAAMQWGQVGDLYVLTFGTGAFARISASIRGSARSLATDEWFANAHRKTKGSEASLQAYLDMERLLGSLDPSARQRTGDVLTTLRLRSVSRGLWSIGQGGRAVRILSLIDIEGEDQFIPISSSGFTDFRLDSVIPPEADCYLIIDTGAEDLVLHVRDTYLDTLAGSTRRKLIERWAREEAAAEISVQRDLISQLGTYVVFHPYPPHPLGIPLLCTILIEVEGSTSSVQHCLDLALDHYRNLPARSSGRPGRSLAPWLRRDSDGVWYLQFGLVGPAIGVADGWIVIGYSPQAVRQNIEYLQSQ